MRAPHGERVPGSNRVWWPWIRAAVGAAIVGYLVWLLGLDPFLDPLRRVDATWLLAGALIAVPTTVCCAWRWRLVSRALGSDLPLGGAVAAYYRSQFLNLVLPGGILGDVHRAVARGRAVGDVGHAARVVVWERTAGQVVQLALTLTVLLLLPSPVSRFVPAVAGCVVAIALAGVLLLRTSAPGTSVPARVARAVRADVRAGLLSARTGPGIVLASAVVVTGHTATFLIAARAAGSTAPLTRLLPLVLLVLLATALPTNVAGWGPREGAAAWLFAVAGLGAAQGLSTAVMYALMALVATLPGAVVLAAGTLRPRAPAVRARTAHG